MAEPKELERLLSAARLWINTLCDVADIDPDETHFRVKVKNADGLTTREVNKSLTETLREIDAAIGKGTPDA